MDPNRRTSAPAALQPIDTAEEDETHMDVDTVSSVQVLCRFRPRHDESPNAAYYASLTNPASRRDTFLVDKENNCIRTNGKDEFDEGRSYYFDKVFGESSTQENIYESVEHIVTGVMSGFNGTLMAYGQTSSGKTHTMEGKMTSEEDFGICPRAVDTLFGCIEDADPEIEFTLKLSFVEIYCEKIRDLLEPDNNNLKIKELPTGELALNNVTELYVTDEDGIFTAMQQGKANRATAPTLMNAESSRSHSLLMITVSQKHLQTEHVVRARLVLGDLAGSERIKKTKVTQMRLEEAKKINQSLTTLGMVINALTDGSSHVPYRNSKLTRVLQESLGGNSRTALIICCSPESEHASESVSTLRFGERASRIRNKIVRNEELSTVELKAMLEDANKEIERLMGVVGGKEKELDEMKLMKGIVAPPKQPPQPPPPPPIGNDEKNGGKSKSKSADQANIIIIKQLKTELKNAEIEKLRFHEERIAWEEEERARRIEEEERDTITTLEIDENEQIIYELKERLADLEPISELLAMEKLAHGNTVAENQSLKEALLLMATPPTSTATVECQTNPLFIEDLIDHNGGMNVSHSFTVDPDLTVTPDTPSKEAEPISSTFETTRKELEKAKGELLESQLLTKQATDELFVTSEKLLELKKEAKRSENGLKRELLEAQKETHKYKEELATAKATIAESKASSPSPSPSSSSPSQQSPTANENKVPVGAPPNSPR